jgi:alkylation response protein AidB-like acyl-CoA dehydrogenase
VDFELTTDQEALVELVRAIVAGRFPIERIRRAEGARAVVDDDDWAALGEAGVWSLRLPEADGGADLGMADAALVFEELGRGLVPGPLVASHLASAHVPGAADGSVMVGAFRRPGPGEPATPLLVEHLDSLGAVVVVGQDGDVSVVSGDALDRLRADAEPVERSIDPLTPLSRLRSEPAGTPLPGVRTDVWRRDWRILTGALCVGAAAATCDRAVDYALVRHQFGKPIGAFQAVKHLCADMLVRVECARSAVRAAAVTVDQPDVGDAERLAAGAGLLAAEAALSNAKACIQVHGGMGFTWEVPVHLYLMRARMLAASLGPTASLAREVAARW